MSGGGAGLGRFGWSVGSAVLLRAVCERNGCEHQRLGEERAADRGLLLDGANAEGGEARGAGEAAGVEQEDGGCSRCGSHVAGPRAPVLCGLLHDDGAEAAGWAGRAGRRATARL